MSSSQNEWVCVCGNIYQTEKSLKQHKRRYCRGGQADNENKCSLCEKEFGTYAGLRQHIKKTHKEHYNELLKTESAGGRQLWTEDEENELAQAESQLDRDTPPSEIIEQLLLISSSSREALKARRRQHQYVAKVESFRRQRTINTEPPVTDIDYNALELRQSDRDEKIRTFLSGLTENLQETIDKNLVENLHQQTPDVAFQSFSEWCELLISEYRNPRINRRPSQNSNREALVAAINRVGQSRRKRRALEYKLAQMDFSRNQKAYANSLLDGFGERETRISPTAEDIIQHYTQIFSQDANAEHPQETTESNTDSKEVSYPITEEEVHIAIRNSKSNSPGPDGVGLKELKSIPIIRLALMFNCMTLLEKVPNCLLQSRTILIPKTSDNLEDVKNWRPITISSIFIRLLNKILAKRLENTIDLHQSQRGFSKIDGCFANNISMETIIKTRRAKGQPFSIISLDLSKAFDRIQHSDIKTALHRLNIDTKSVNLIMSNFIGAATEISCNGQSIGNLSIKRGVKQGDPLSPLLFNIVLDELLCDLEHSGGIPIGEEKISTMAYADDILLCAEDDRDAGRMLEKTVQFFKKKDLHINTLKSSSLILKRVPSKKKLYVETEPTFKVDDVYIPVINIQKVLSYLGQKFSFEGMKKCSTLTLYDQLTAIRRAPLKPQQKMKIVTTYLIPRYIDSLQKPNVSANLLKEVDKKIRSLVRKILHLPLHCSNSLFYAPLKAGGLGIFSFQYMIPVITRNRMEKLRAASRLLSDTISLAQPMLDRIKKQFNQGWRNTSDVRKHLTELFHRSYNGKGLEDAANNYACRKFITDPPIFWSGGNYIKAIQLRFNVLPTVGIPSNPPEARRCRARCFKSESLSHVLQQCPLTHHQRMARHDHVLKRLSDAVKKKGWNITLEPHIRGADGILHKPDIIMIKEHQVIVSDVGIGWEGSITLDDQYNHKVAKYNGPYFISKLQEMYPGKPIAILPVIIGARGTWCQGNELLINETNIPRRHIEDFITTTLRGGWMTHEHFMRSVWRRLTTNQL